MHVFGYTTVGKGRGNFVSFDVGTAGGKGAQLVIPGDPSTGAAVGRAVGSLFGLDDEGEAVGGAVGSALGSTYYPRAAAGDSMLVVDVNFTQQEKYSTIHCFNDSVWTYAFGHNAAASTVNLTFLTFLAGCADGVNSDGSADNPLRALITAYGENRISKTQRMAYVSLGANINLRGFIVGVKSSTHSAEHNIQSYGVTLLAVNPQVV